MEITIRKADAADLDAVARVYEHVHDAEEAGPAQVGWVRGVYPVRSTAEAALERGDLFVEEADGAVVGTGIFNRLQADVYAGAPWQYDAPDDQIMVLHTLVVDPQIAGHGYGKAFVSFYEQYAKDHDCPYLRMDTNAINTAARRFYAKLGFRESGIVGCTFNGIPGVRLVCLKKKLDF